MVVVLTLLTVTAWSAPGPSVSNHFVPDEIVVKFRTPTPDANLVESISDGRSDASHGLPAPGRRFRVREMRPILEDFDRRQTQMRRLGDSDLSRLTQRQRRLLQRQKRAAVPGRRPELGNIYRVRVDLDPGESLEKVLAAYRTRADVEYAELNPIISACVTPNDRSYADQWALTKVHAAEAWDTCRGSSDIIVAVIDTGVDYDHPDLQGNLWTNEAERDGLPWVDDDDNGYVDDIRGYNFVAYNNDPKDDHGHGTAMAGIIAAVGNNETDIAGVCWVVRIMPVKVLGAAGDGTAADAVPAIYYAVANGADIISGSWGGAETSNALRDAIAYAHEEGVVVVAAAGNNGSGNAYYPAAYPDVISVAATDSDDRRWFLSNYGDWVDIAAPGREIVSLHAMLPGQATRTAVLSRMSGTSLAAPHVSGACALLLAADPFLRCDELPRILTATADPIEPGICASNGRLNVYAALRAVIPPEGTIRMDRTYYPDGADVALLLADWHLRGAGQFTVSIDTAGGDHETVALKETNVSLGVLRGTIASRNAAVAVGDGILQVHDGEGIQARYLDSDDGQGDAGEWRLAIALADFRPPTVVSVDANAQSATATIEVRTNEPTRAEVRFSATAAGPFVSVQRDPALNAQHSIQLRGLARQTRYYFVVALADEAGNEAVADNDGQNYSFATEP